MDYEISVSVAFYPVSIGSVKNFKQEKGNVAAILSEGTLCISSLSDNSVWMQYYSGAKAEVQELVLFFKAYTPHLKVSDAASDLEVKVKNHLKMN